MNRFSSMTQKATMSPHYKSKHCRSNSIRSYNHSNGKKVPVTSRMYEKVLTQTTTSKYKRNHQLTPKRSCNTTNKNKVDKGLNESKTLKKTNRGQKGKDSLYMAQSLNIPNLQSFAKEEYTRNKSQQLSSNNMDSQIFINPNLAEILIRTQKVFKYYQQTCKSLQKQQKEAQRELMQAKTQILLLQNKLSKSKNKNL